MNAFMKRDVPYPIERMEEAYQEFNDLSRKAADQVNKMEEGYDPAEHVLLMIEHVFVENLRTQAMLATVYEEFLKLARIEQTA